MGNETEIKIVKILAEKAMELNKHSNSVLQTIPFLLSHQPSEEWCEIFIQTWDSPPTYSSMHRPGKASVSGKIIYLKGTTLDEIKKYHKKTLLLCVEAANTKEKERLIRKTKQEERIKKEEQEKGEYIAKRAKEIKFE